MKSRLCKACRAAALLPGRSTLVVSERMPLLHEAVLHSDNGEFTEKGHLQGEAISHNHTPPDFNKYILSLLKCSGAYINSSPSLRTEVSVAARGSV